MTIRPDPSETDTAHTERLERIERTERVEAQPMPAVQTNVQAAPAPGPVWTATRVVTLLFTVLEVLLLLRFTFKLFGANQGQALVALLYGITEPLVRPFQGIFAVPADSALDLAALLAIVFLFLVAALIVALVRAVNDRRVV